MSMFSIPDDLLPDVKQFEKMSKEINALLPTELAGAVNLMAHPAVGFAAVSALGLGFASHALGVWMGAVAGMAEVSQRLFVPASDEAPKEPVRARQQIPVARARVSAKMLIDDARQAAAGAVQAEAKLADIATERVEAVVEKAAETPPAAPAIAEPAAELMPEDFRQPKAVEIPEAPDDLKKISGIGPKLETVLNGLGVWTYAQIAAWRPAEVAWVDDYLSFKGRIGRDGWIEQAKTLAGTGTKH